MELIKLSHYKELTLDDPNYKTEGAAAIDLHYCGYGNLNRQDLYEPTLLPTGIKMHIADPNYVGILAARSSLGHKLDVQLSGGLGVIDSDYQGEIFVSAVARPQLMHDYSEEYGKYRLQFDESRDSATLIEPGQRIAQLLIVPIVRPNLVFVEEFTESSNRAGGFGSTGK